MTSLYGIPCELAAYGGARFGVVPVPFDKTSTWIKGADKGPEALIDASQQVELYDMETDTEVYKSGIYLHRPVNGPDPMLLAERVEECVRDLLGDKKVPIVLGGEHSVSIGSVLACASRFDSLNVLHLDAHADRREDYEGSSYNHACVAARMAEVAEKVVSVGIRSMDVTEKGAFGADNLFTAHTVHRSPTWIEDVLQALGDIVYISIDLDVFDPSIMPSTGTPEPGGLDWYQVTQLCRAVFEQKRVVGFDLVELCPGPDKAPDFLAAKLLYKLMSYSALYERMA